MPNNKNAKKLTLKKMTVRSLADLSRVAGGPGHRTSFRCTENWWETCISYCEQCQETRDFPCCTDTPSCP